MKRNVFRAVTGLTLVLSLVLAACDLMGGGNGDNTDNGSGSGGEHLAMLRSLGVDVDPDPPLAPNKASYDPATAPGPVGKVFSRPKREIFAAGYSSTGATTYHALFEDFENKQLTQLGTSSNSTEWDKLDYPKKSVAADLDGDGIDEVVIVTLSSKMLISKGVYKDGKFTVTTAQELPTPEAVGTMVPDGAPDVLDLTGWKLIAADLNGDGKQECVLTLPGLEGGYIYIFDNNLKMIKNENLRPRYVSNFPGGGHRCFPMVTAADYDQDGKDEICFMLGANAEGFTAPYALWDDQDAGFAELQKGTVNHTKATIGVGNVIAADFTGDGLPDTVFYGKQAGGLNNLVLFETALDSSFKPTFNSVETASHRTYAPLQVIPRLAAGDFNGDRIMDLYFANTVWTLKAGKFEKLTNDIFKQYTANREDAHEVVMGDVTGDMKDDVVNFHTNGRIQICYATIGDEYSVSDLKPFTGSTRETGCLPNVDDDTLILLDTGQRELLFTDPQVIAVLASPPYHAGINNDGDGGTSFGYSKASGSTESNTLGFSVGASIGGGFEIPGIIETEFKTTITSSFGWTQSQSRELSESWGWNAPVGEDRVIFTAIPFDVYYYEVLSAPPGGETKPGDMITVNVPRKPNQYHKPLTTYNAVVPEEQRITLNHELGNPGSYFTPTGRDAEKFKAGNKGLFSTTTVMTAGEGNGSTTISIETVKTEEKSFAFDLDVEVEAEVEAGGVKMGVSAGFNYGYETTTSVSSGTYIEGAVPAIPEGSYSHDRDFKWGLMAYPKENKYTLVTYWVDPL